MNSHTRQETLSGRDNLVGGSLPTSVACFSPCLRDKFPSLHDIFRAYLDVYWSNFADSLRGDERPSPKHVSSIAALMVLRLPLINGSI